MRKLLSVLLVLSLSLIPMAKANAAEQVVDSEGSYDIDIIVEIPSTFEVTMPDLVEITKKEVKGFTITGTGNISASQYLEIGMPSTVTMSTEGKNDVQLNLSIDKTRYSQTELAADGGVTSNCSVDATSISSGVWRGSAEVTVTLKNL